MFKKFLFTLYVLLLVGLWGCAKKSTKPNNPPTTPTITASATTVKSGETVNLTVSATDPDGDPLTYSWSATGGSFNTTSGTSVIWAAPAVSDTQQYTISVEVKDDEGARATSSVNVTVAPQPKLMTEQDFTGDGTLDLRADNGIMWVRVNRDPVQGVKGFIDAGGISGQGNFLGIRIFSDGMVDQTAYWQTKTFSVQIIENTSQKGVYKVTCVDTANGKEVTKEFTVTLEASKEYAWVDYRYTNTSSSSWTYDETPSHIHDGAMLATVQSAELQDIEAYVNGVGVINLKSLSWWTSYTPDQTAPFFVLYRPSSGSAVTFGFKYLWDYSIHQVVAYYTGASPAIEPKLEPMATEFSLSPNASARWKALIAFHTGGYSKGIQIYQGARQ